METHPSTLRVCLTTVPNAQVADQIAEVLVAAHLVACVNIVPGLRSVYWWKGQVCRDDELLLVMKTRADLVPAVSEKIKALHPYEVPEFIALPLEGGSAAYLRWILDATDRPTA